MIDRRPRLIARCRNVADVMSAVNLAVPTVNSAMREYWNALHPLSAGGAYVNFLMDAANEDEGRVAASYRDNYERLAAVKAIYDPNNLFSVNQNIKPGIRANAPSPAGHGHVKASDH
jgi:hypothetical protein